MAGSTNTGARPTWVASFRFRQTPCSSVHCAARPTLLPHQSSSTSGAFLPRARKCQPRRPAEPSSTGGSSSNARRIRAQFRHPALALHGLQRHARLEPRVEVPAFPHVQTSSFLEANRCQIVAYLNVRFSGSAQPRQLLDSSAQAKPCPRNKI